MGILIFNSPGLAIVALAIAMSCGMGVLANRSEEGPLTVSLGLFVLIFELAYRLLRKEGHWLLSDRGGS